MSPTEVDLFRSEIVKVLSECTLSGEYLPEIMDFRNTVLPRGPFYDQFVDVCLSCTMFHFVHRAEGLPTLVDTLALAKQMFLSGLFLGSKVAHISEKSAASGELLKKGEN